MKMGRYVGLYANVTGTWIEKLSKKMNIQRKDELTEFNISSSALSEFTHA